MRCSRAAGLRAFDLKDELDADALARRLMEG